MAEFRMAQSHNYGYTPNPALPNVYMALAHDLGDPWWNPCDSNWRSPPYACLILNDSYIPVWSENDTHWLMSDVHPRTKRPLGQRLAQVMYGVLYNNSVYDYQYRPPLISGCKLNNQTGKIVVSFNTTFLNGNSIDYIPFKRNGNETFNGSSAMQIEIDNVWYFVDIGTDGRQNDNEIIVDITPYKNKIITGISYGWTDCPCCGIDLGTGKQNTVPSGIFNWATMICPMGSCEIKAGNNKDNTTNLQLPAVPFMAQIVNNSCSCTPPQVCDG